MNKKLPLCEELSSNFVGKSTGLPPSEKHKNVIQFELTSGCNYNGCNFCSFYKTEKFKEQSLWKYKAHVDHVWRDINKLKDKDNILNGLERIFIGGGNALCVDTIKLHKAITYTISSFLKHARTIPKRVALYGNVRDIINKSQEELDFLNCGGTCATTCASKVFGKNRSLDLIYLGIESGSDEVLKFVNKGYTKGDLFKASRNVNRSGFRTSIMVMPGLGGIKYLAKHAQDTAEVLNHFQPAFLTFMSINMEDESSYTKKMLDEEKKRTNRRLTDCETAEQIGLIINDLTDYYGCAIGCYQEETPEAKNPIQFKFDRSSSSFKRKEIVWEKVKELKKR